MSFSILAISSVFTGYMVFLNIFRYKMPIWKISIAIILTYFVLITVVFVFSHIHNPVFDAEIFANVAFTGCLILFAYIQTRKLLLSTHYALSTIVIAMIGSILASIFVNNILGITIDDARSNYFLYYATVIPSIPICYALSRFIGCRLHNAYIQLSDEIKQKFALYGFILSALTYLLTHANVFLYRIISDRALLSAIDIIVVTSLFLVAITMMASYSLIQQKHMEAEYRVKAEKALVAHNQKLEESYNEMRSFRHDHLNLLHSLIGLAYDDNPMELRKRLIQAMDYSKEIFDSIECSMARLDYIRIPELKGLVAVKYAQAQVHGLTVDLDIAEPVETIPVNIMELCRIVGIMMDNAVEELSSNEYEHRVIKFGIIVDYDDILIICANPCKNPPPVASLFKPDFSTKGAGRGLGLYNLKQLCNDNGNILVTVRINNGEFALILTIRQV